MKRHLLIASATAVLASTLQAAEVPYPAGYRDWRHVKTMTLNKGHSLYEAVGGIHHIYANKKALAGYKAGKFGDGATLVFDLFEAVDKDNAVSEGSRKAVVVMTKNAKAHASTDGWGYQVFDAKTGKPTIDAKGQADCHACHIAQKAKDFVFSAPRD